MDRIRILIADDHTLFREGVHALLGAAPDTEVVGQAASGEEAIAQGHSNAVIAERLILSPKTVSNHISNIFSSCRWPTGRRPSSGRGAGLGKEA